MLRIAVLVSGGGTNLQALIDYEKAGKLKGGSLSLVVSSKEDAYALQRAEKYGIKTVVVSRKAAVDSEQFCHQLLKVMEAERIDLVVLAGFLCILTEDFTKRYRHRIINVHPSLIPSFCGEGYYGLRVHEAALAYGAKTTGATVHFVNEIPDGGEIILQKAVDIRDDDAPESLQQRVMEEAEWEILPLAVSLFCEGRLSVQGRRVIIKEE